MENLRVRTWHSIGTDVKEASSIDEVLRVSNLDYEVIKRPVFYQDHFGMSQIPDRFLTLRNDGSKIYDVVSNRFEIIQNQEAFDFVNYMGNDLIFEKAGETPTGMVYVIASLPKMNILGDEFTPFVILRNGFTGRTNVTAAICPLRIVCENQFNFSFKETNNTVSIRHTANAKNKLEEAKEVLKLSADYMQRLNDMANEYANIKISEFELHKFMNLAFPLDGIEELSTRKRNSLEEKRTDFRNAYLQDDNQNFRGTAWGLINAYTDLLTHQKARGKEETKHESKFQKVTFDTPMNNVLEFIKAVKVA